MQINTQIQEKTLILSVSVEKTFGYKLKAWRKAKGMTQLELAEASGVNVSYISNLERDFSANKKSGVPKASESLIERFSKVLGVELDEIRLSAGYAPENSKLPPKLAAIGFTELSDDDVEKVASYIEFLKSQKGK